MDVMGLLMRWLHIFPAILLVGGTLFMRIALVPSAEELPDAEHEKLREAIRERWAKWVHGAVGLLLVSGLFNMMAFMTKYKPTTA
ncbi:MAG: hypothetical protein N2C14_16195, partial [Planctomycetales bacterium]